jgi:hypothetical protein
MRVYKRGDRLHHTYDIWADNDTTAKDLAQQKFDELAAELAGQVDPKIDDPTLEGFRLYDGERLICEPISVTRR